MDIDISEIESKNERGLYNSLPLRGGRWRRRRRMRAESSFLYPPNKRDSRTLQKIPTSQTKPKTSPMTPPLSKNETNLRFLSGGDMGEVLGERGRFGGESPVFQEGALPPPRSSPLLPPRSSFPSSTHAPLQTPSRGKWGSWGSECRARRARGRRSTRQAPVNPSRGKALQPSEETEATGAGARQNPRET